MLEALDKVDPGPTANERFETNHSSNAYHTILAGQMLAGVCYSIDSQTITGLEKFERQNCTTIHLMLSTGEPLSLDAMKVLFFSLDAKSRKIFPGLFTLLNILYWFGYLYLV